MLTLQALKIFLKTISIASFGLACTSVTAQESELERLVNSVQNSLPVNQYSEHQDTVMKLSCDGLNWTLAWSERPNQLTGKIILKDGLKVYDVTEIERGIFDNFSMINTPILTCSHLDQTGTSSPTRIFVTGTEINSSNSKSVEIFFDALAENPVTIRSSKARSFLVDTDQKTSQFDELIYDTNLTCSGYKWNLEWKKTALESKGTVSVAYGDQHVKYGPTGTSVFDKFSQMGTPSLLCSTPRNATKPHNQSVSSQLRLGGFANSGNNRARAVFSAHLNQGLLVLDVEGLSK